MRELSDMRVVVRESSDVSPIFMILIPGVLVRNLCDIRVVVRELSDVRVVVTELSDRVLKTGSWTI